VDVRGDALLFEALHLLEHSIGSVAYATVCTAACGMRCVLTVQVVAKGRVPVAGCAVGGVSVDKFTFGAVTRVWLKRWFGHDRYWGLGSKCSVVLC